MILDNISLILLLPLWIFLIIMCGRFFAVYVNKSIIYFLTLFGSFSGAGITSYALIKINNPIECSYPFIRINDFILSFGLRVDKISLIIALVLFIVSFSVQLFSISYLKEEKKNYRFFALLNLFNFSMAALLFSPNLFQFYIFWELVGIVSYLLIGFDYGNIIKSDASKRVFIINRIGDTALISAIILTSFYMYNFVGNKSFVTLSFEDFNAISTMLMAYTSNIIFYLICGLFIIAAIVKSAQFPFYTWLQDAMEAKLPVSALLHSATMVVAGVYLIIRLMPFFTLNAHLLNVILIVGFLTSLICSILASIETHPKKVLAYSTSAILGLMFIALGSMNVKLALVLLTVHAFIKSALFILLPKDDTIAKTNFILFIINALSLCGIILSGIGAKELLYKIFAYNQHLSYLYIFVCFISAFYIIRLVVLIYKNHKLTSKNNITEFFALLILLFVNVLLYLVLRLHYTIEAPYAAAIGGTALALLLGKHNALEKFKSTPKIFEKLFNNSIPKVYDKYTSGMNHIENKILSNYKPILFISKLPVKITGWFEEKIMNGTIRLVTNIFREISKRYMVLQTGNVQTYNTYALIIITIITALVLISFWVLTRMY